MPTDAPFEVEVAPEPEPAVPEPEPAVQEPDEIEPDKTAKRDSRAEQKTDNSEPTMLDKWKDWLKSLMNDVSE